MRSVWLLLLVIASGLGFYLFTRFEGTPPSLETATDPIWIGAREPHTHAFRIGDSGTGLREVAIRLEGVGSSRELLRQSYDGSLFRGARNRAVQEISVEIDPKELGLSDGQMLLRAEARDFSWRSNSAAVEVPVTVDTRPPRVSVRTGLTYAQPGGTRIAVYGVSEAAARHGVEVGDRFFPGYAHPNRPGLFAALYALPLDGAAAPRVLAEDRAGNRAQVGLGVQMLPRPRPGGTIELGLEFMQGKIGELLGTYDGDPLEGYLKINRDMREANAQKIRELCRSSGSEILWHGAFASLPNGETREKFGVRRTYRYGGRDVDQQTHLGLDFASLSHAPVPAANDGKVVFADDLGIYGRTVVLDHGLGLFSLYSHLSDIAVAPGAAVTRGEELGHTGTTGLAGGDHLHFSMIVSGEFVEPEEWLDPKWIRDHVDSRLGAEAEGG